MDREQGIIIHEVNGCVELRYQEGSKVYRAVMPIAMARAFVKAGVVQFFQGHQFFVNVSGDPSVGIASFFDEVFIFAESGNFGGDDDHGNEGGPGPTDFQSFMMESLPQWYDEKGCVDVRPPSFYDAPLEGNLSPEKAAEALAVAISKDDRVRLAVDVFFWSSDGEAAEIALLKKLEELEALTRAQGIMAIVDRQRSHQENKAVIYFHEDDIDYVLEITRDGQISVTEKQG